MFRSPTCGPFPVPEAWAVMAGALRPWITANWGGDVACAANSTKMRSGIASGIVQEKIATKKGAVGNRGD